MASTAVDFRTAVILRVVPRCIFSNNSHTLGPLLQAPAWGNPAHPYTICANGVWCVLFGWQMALAHLTAALFQALTVIGLGTALTNVQLAQFAM